MSEHNGQGPGQGAPARQVEEEATQVIDNSMVRDIRESAQKVQAYIVVLSGPEIGATRRLDQAEVVLGRSQETTMRIKDVGISRRHARLLSSTYGVVIEDMGSANGTFVNGERISRPVQLRDGDKITLGSTTILKFTYHDKLDEDFQRKLLEAAQRDSLTQAYNKGYFLEHLSAEFTYARRHHVGLGLALFDVDHFKRVNDTFGHLAGDHVLIRLTELAHESLRHEDLFARYGGEEFAIVCRGATMEQTARLGDRFRALIERTPFIYEGRELPVRISVGIAGVLELPVDSPEALIAAADSALYAAKNSGRNRVMLAMAR